MKKILLGLFFTMFAMQVNAASITSIPLTMTENSISGGFFSTLYENSPGEIEGTSRVEGDFTIVYDLSANLSTGLRNVTVENTDASVTIESVKLVDSTNVANFWLGDFDDAGEWMLSAYLLDTTAYTLTIIGTLAGTSFGTVTTTVSSVPLPAAVWLFGSALVGLFGASRRKSTAVAA